MRHRNLHLFFLAALFSIVATACGGGKNKFSVVGDISGMPEQKLYLLRLDVVNRDRPVLVDSTTSTAQGHFELKGTLDEPGIYLLKPEVQSDRHAPNNQMLLSLEAGTTKVKADWSAIHKYEAQSSPSSNSLNGFMHVWREHVKKLNAIGIVMQDSSVMANDSLMQKAVAQEADIRASFTQAIEEYADTTKFLPNALFAVQMLYIPAEKQFLSAFVGNLPARFPNNTMATAYTTFLQQKLNELQQQQDAINNSPVGVGKQAPEITLPDVNGKEVSLSSLKGKYVLVDFWASWCAPCRRENPNVVSAYNTYKDKNFTVLGVSLDEKKEDWLQAIKDDGLTWTHISDLKGWQSVVVRTYMIQGIPTNVLLDTDGKIIARDLRGPELLSKLEQLLQ